MSKLRVSSYIIPIEVGNGKVMLIHGYTGAMDVVDKELATLLKDSFNKSFNTTVLDEETCTALQKRGYLTTFSEDEERQYVWRFAQALHRKDRLLCSSFTIVVTYDCNFRCPYCFERDVASERLRRCMFTPEMVDKMYHAIDELRSNAQSKTDNIALFGGEPLLKENKEIVTYIINKGTEKGFKFHAITNGYDLDEYIDLLSPTQIEHVQITIDGSRDVHNSKRIHALGEPTFDKIVFNIGEALKKDIFVTIRFNTDRNNIQELDALKGYFDELGYTAYKKFSIDSARLVNYDESLSKEEQKQFFSAKEFVEMHEKLGFSYGCHDFGTYKRIYNAMSKKLPLPYRGTFCPLTAGGYVFDSFGRIYPCWEVIGKPQFQIGSYGQGYLQWNNEKMREWRDCNVTCYESCQACKCALLCGGGCHAQNLEKHKCTNMMEIIRYAAKRAYHNCLINK